MTPYGIDEGERLDGDDWGDRTATFGDRLVHARERAGLTRSDLAHRMGIKPQTLGNWEEDRSEPRANRLQMLAGVLNVSMIWLMSGQGAAPAGPQPGHSVDLVWCVGEIRAIRLEHGRLSARLGRLEARMVISAHSTGGRPT